MSGNSLRDQLSGLMQARKQQAQSLALEAEKKKAARITKEKNKSTEKKDPMKILHQIRQTPKPGCMLV